MIVTYLMSGSKCPLLRMGNMACKVASQLM